jgi:hypothetical protein
MPPRLETLDHCAAFDAASQHHQRTIAATIPRLALSERAKVRIC